MFDKVNYDHKPVLITRQNGRPAVLMNLEDYEGQARKTLITWHAPKTMSD